MGLMDDLSNLAKKAQAKVQEVAAKVQEAAAKVTAPEVEAAAVPVQDWHYTMDGKTKHGPFSFDQLKKLAEAGQLKPLHMVRQDGMAKWLAAGQIEPLWTTKAPATRPFSPGPVVRPPQPTPPPLPANPDEMWYYTVNGRQVGPVTEAQLKVLVRSGELSRTDMVWKVGMSGWDQAGHIKGLFEDRSSIPPPLPHQRLFDLAVEHHRKGDVDKAIVIYSDYIRQCPDNATAYYNRGINYSQQGDDARAFADFKEAHGLSPDDADIRSNLAVTHYNRGIDYTKQGDSARALADFKEAFRLDPTKANYRHNVAAGHHSLGVKYFEDKDFAHAKAEFEEAVRLDPNDTDDTNYRQCLAVAKQALVVEATVPTRETPAEKQANPFGGRSENSGRTMTDAGGTMDAKKMVQAAAHLEQANKQRRAGEWDAAIHEYTVAINLIPRNFFAYCGRGLAFNGKGNETGDKQCFQFAEADLATAIAIGSDDPGLMAEAHYNRGCVLTDDLGRHDEAIADFHRTLEIKPDDYGAQQGLERAQAATGNDVRAPAEVNQLDPNHPANLAVVHADRGMDYHNKGDDVRALAEFKEANRLDPNRADFRKSLAALHGNLAMQYVNNKDWAHAKAECEEAFRLDPDTKTYRECLDELESALKDKKEAEEVEDEDEVEPDPISMICPHCLAHYRARLHIGETTRCENCLEDFVVYALIGEPSTGLLEGLNPLAWFASEKCPQCRSVAVKLGRIEKPPEWLSADAVWHGFADYYLCKKCRITWLRSYGFRM